LTPKAFETLRVLVEQSGHLVERDVLLKAVWPNTVVEDGGLTRNISVLRRILGGGNQPKLIETVPTRGYRFVAAVKMTAGREPATKPETLRHISPNEHKTGSPLKSIAVLPFKLIGTNDAEYLGLGMADTLITKLSSIRQIAIRPTGSIHKYSAPRQDPQAAGRELKVDTVLDGSLQISNKRLRVTVRLLRVSDGRALWAEAFDAEFTHIFAVQDSISERVARALMLQLTVDEKRRLTRRYTDNTEAYQFYLKGLYFLNKRTRDGLQRGIEYFQKAIECDPQYALAYTGLADSYNHFDRYGVLPAKEAAPRGRAAALKALEIDPTLAEAHTSLAHSSFFWEWDWSAAERQLTQALDLNPSYADAHLRYGAYHSAMGRLDEALAEMKRAQELDPISLIINTLLGRTLYFGRRFDDAIEQLRRTLEIDSNFERAHFFLGRTYMQQGRSAEAVAELQHAVVLSDGSPTFVGALGYAYGRSGDKGRAYQLISQLHEISLQRYVSSYDLALIYVGLGENDEALESLEAAYEERSSWMIFLQVTPEFDGLRADPRFMRLLHRIGLSVRPRKSKRFLSRMAVLSIPYVSALSAMAC